VLVLRRFGWVQLFCHSFQDGLAGSYTVVGTTNQLIFSHFMY